MFKKILIVEDIDSINLGVTALLEKNFDVSIHSTKYCDEAYLKIHKAAKQKRPYDLMITDLSFKEDINEPRIKSGEELISHVRRDELPLKILVYSIEDKGHLIRSLFYKEHINGFVAKGRESTTELLEAIEALYRGDIYVSPQMSSLLRDQPIFEVDKYDIEVLKMLSEGMTQEEISYAFKMNEYPSASTSSIEKKINRLKFTLKAANSIQLIAIAKDMRLI